METHEVVIVGGGAMGASVAWHLRELGVDDVVCSSATRSRPGRRRARPAGSARSSRTS
jgi:glycine/D-amino acid oxidase-like deaminating enzyme